MSQPLIELSVDFVIECAHQMMEFPEGHPNRRIHGHTYYGVVKLVGSIDPETGYVMDAMELKQHRQGPERGTGSQRSHRSQGL